MEQDCEALRNGDRGAGGVSWAERSRMGPLRGVIDSADLIGRRNAYMHALHVNVLERELARVRFGTHFLDFGCGTGRFISTLSKRCIRLVAVDKEPAMIQAAKTYAAAQNVQFECCDPVNVRFERGYFDFVLCSSVLCVTVPHLLEPIVLELGRVTRRGGCILLLEQVSAERRLPLRRYRDALRKAGFVIERAYPIRRATSLPTSMVARHDWIPARWFGALATVEVFVTAALPARAADPYVEYAISAFRSP